MKIKFDDAEESALESTECHVNINSLLFIFIILTLV